MQSLKSMDTLRRKMVSCSFFKLSSDRQDNTEESKIKILAATDEKIGDGSIASSLIQMYLQHILECMMNPADLNLAKVSFQLVEMILDLGLENPLSVCFSIWVWCSFPSVFLQSWPFKHMNSLRSETERFQFMQSCTKNTRVSWTQETEKVFSVPLNFRNRKLALLVSEVLSTFCLDRLKARISCGWGIGRDRKTHQKHRMSFGAFLLVGPAQEREAKRVLVDDVAILGSRQGCKPQTDIG